MAPVMITLAGGSAVSFNHALATSTAPVGGAATALPPGGLLALPGGRTAEGTADALAGRTDGAGMALAIAALAATLAEMPAETGF